MKLNFLLVLPVLFYSSSIYSQPVHQVKRFSYVDPNQHHENDECRPLLVESSRLPPGIKPITGIRHGDDDGRSYLCVNGVFHGPGDPDCGPEFPHFRDAR